VGCDLTAGIEPIRRDLSTRHYVYIWADGVYLQTLMEENAECMLVVIGATPEGKKELIGFQVGLWESAQSWHELLAGYRQVIGSKPQRGALVCFNLPLAHM
jgi:transposase-like protein